MKTIAIILLILAITSGCQRDRTMLHTTADLGQSGAIHIYTLATHQSKKTTKEFRVGMKNWASRWAYGEGWKGKPEPYINQYGERRSVHAWQLSTDEEYYGLGPRKYTDGFPDYHISSVRYEERTHRVALQRYLAQTTFYKAA